MKTNNKIVALGLLALMIVSTSAVLAADYTVDGDHSAVNFQIKHLTISKVNGTFGEVTGSDPRSGSGVLVREYQLSQVIGTGKACASPEIINLRFGTVVLSEVRCPCA